MNKDLGRNVEPAGADWSHGTRTARVRVKGRDVWAKIEGNRLVEIGDSLFAAPRGTDLGPLSEARFLAPIAATNKVIGLMGNFMGPTPRKGPGLFIKPSTTIIGAGDDIRWPPGVPSVNFEAELGVVIGKQAKELTPEAALDHVYGYTVTNDMTSFSVLGEDGASALSIRFKMYDDFLPIGPWIVSGIEIGNNRLWSRLNGETKQDVSLATMDFSVAQVVSWVSRVMTLFPGDIISMGTPPGYVDMAPGDIIECEIDGIGILTNRLVRD